jgi:hypothetical protein
MPMLDATDFRGVIELEETPDEFPDEVPVDWFRPFGVWWRPDWKQIALGDYADWLVSAHDDLVGIERKRDGMTWPTGYNGHIGPGDNIRVHYTLTIHFTPTRQGDSP